MAKVIVTEEYYRRMGRQAELFEATAGALHGITEARAAGEARMQRREHWVFVLTVISVAATVLSVAVAVIFGVVSVLDAGVQCSPGGPC